MNRAEYQGKTRDDFVALEASIHDFTGASPSDDGTQKQKFPTSAAEDSGSNTDRAAAVSLQELAAGISGRWAEETSAERLGQDDLGLP